MYPQVSGGTNVTVGGLDEFTSWGLPDYGVPRCVFGEVMVEATLSGGSPLGGVLADLLHLSY